MSANLARTADGWWAVTPAGLVRLGLPATTTAGLLADRAALTAAIEAAHAADAQDAVSAGSLDLHSPVTAPARVVAQAVNYRSHATDSGFDPDTVPAAFFRKASHSITGPDGDIIRPDGVGFLDYEVELGLVIGADMPVGTTVTDADLARFPRENVIASMQPLHMQWRQDDFSDSWAARLGPERASRAWRTVDLLRAGVTLALGSDWPVAQNDPRIGMAWARLRRQPGAPDRRTFEPDQRLSGLEALEGYTTGAAAAVGDSALGGRIAPGLRADLTILAEDPVLVDADNLPDLPVRMTIVDGEIVYAADG